MYCAVYTCKILKQFSDKDLIKLFQIIQRKNFANHITGCLVHFGDEFFQVVQGKLSDVTHLYTVDGIDKQLWYGTPIFVESGSPFLFEFSYIVSESLQNVPGANAVPVLNHQELYLLRYVLGTQTLALTFFWKCLQDVLEKRSESGT